MKKFLVYSLATLLPIAVVFYFFQFYRNDNRITLSCPFHSATGLWCPGCGGQRAFSLLTHGHILESLRFNLLLPLALYFSVFYYYSAIANIFFKVPFSNKLNISFLLSRNFLIFLFIYAVLRNIPLKPFIYLAPY